MFCNQSVDYHITRRRTQEILFEQISKASLTNVLPPVYGREPDLEFQFRISRSKSEGVVAVCKSDDNSDDKRPLGPADWFTGNFPVKWFAASAVRWILPVLIDMQMRNVSSQKNAEIIEFLL